jgi:hypothetical protein
MTRIMLTLIVLTIVAVAVSKGIDFFHDKEENKD